MPATKPDDIDDDENVSVPATTTSGANVSSRSGRARLLKAKLMDEGRGSSVAAAAAVAVCGKRSPYKCTVCVIYYLRQHPAASTVCKRSVILCLQF